MKRSGEESDASTSSKRAKLENAAVFDDPRLAWDAQDLCERGVDDIEGFISCTCFMSWKPNQKKYSTLLKIQKDRGLAQKIEVDFAGGCVDYFDRIRFQANDTLLISLKGVQITRLKTCKAACTLPMRFTFDEGVVLKFTKRFGQPKNEVVDTWAFTKTQEKANPLDWFTSTPQWPVPATAAPPPPLVTGSRSLTTAENSPPITAMAEEFVIPKASHLMPSESSRTNAIATAVGTWQVHPDPKPVEEDAGVISPLVTERPKAEGATEEHAPVTESTIASKSSLPQNQAENNTLPPPVQQPALTKKQMKKLRRKQRKLEEQHATVPSAPQNQGGSHEVLVNQAMEHASVPVLPTTPIIAAPAVDPVPAVEDVPASDVRQDKHGTSDPAPSMESKPQEPLSMKAGVVADVTKYRAIQDLKAGTFADFIGIVATCTEPRVTKSNDWMVKIKLLDPSNTEIEHFGLEGFPINFFALFEDWLPQVNKGDILLVRDIKIDNYQGHPVGVGYKDRAQWAIYSRHTKEFGHGDRKDSPENIRLAGDEGGHFAPFFHPGRISAAYCGRLCNWWEEVEKARREFLGDNHQIEAVPTTPGQVTRIHRLISDIGPEQEPRGYFNCTVEVLHLYSHDNNVTSLYVTDYTQNDEVVPTAASWCLESLRPYVLKIEAWDAAASALKETGIETGTYYSIRNVRARRSKRGYLEGKLQEDKMTKLDPADAIRNPHLKALLDRKAAHQAAHPNDSLNVFPDLLINEAIEGTFFNCVVEVVKSVFNNNSLSYLLVTDYSRRNDVQKVFPEHHTVPEGCLLRIDLWDHQIQKAQVLEKGRFYSIQKLRLKKDHGTNYVIGKLGGNENLITLAKPTDDKVVALLKRKDSVYEATTTQQPSAQPEAVKAEPAEQENNLPLKNVHSPGEPSSTDVKREHRAAMQSIAEIVNNPTRPNVFTVRGRVIDYRPTDLREIVTLHCKNCDEDIIRSQAACFACQDFEHTYLQRLYEMVLLIQDAQGSMLQVAIHDQSPIFDDLERKDTRDDTAAYNAILERLKPILGHSSRRRNSRNELLDSPLLDLELDSWSIETNDVCENIYALTAYR